MEVAGRVVFRLIWLIARTSPSGSGRGGRFESRLLSMANPALDRSFVGRRAKTLTRGDRCDLAASMLREASERLLSECGSATVPRDRSLAEVRELQEAAEVAARRARQALREGFEAVELGGAHDDT